LQDKVNKYNRAREVKGTVDDLNIIVPHEGNLHVG
jgi:hypothetical protein